MWENALLAVFRLLPFGNRSLNSSCTPLPITETTCLLQVSGSLSINGEEVGVANSGVWWLVKDPPIESQESPKSGSAKLPSIEQKNQTLNFNKNDGVLLSMIVIIMDALFFIPLHWVYLYTMNYDIKKMMHKLKQAFT